MGELRVRGEGERRKEGRRREEEDIKPTRGKINMRQGSGTDSVL